MTDKEKEDISTKIIELKVIKIVYGIATGVMIAFMKIIEACFKIDISYLLTLLSF